MRSFISFNYTIKNPANEIVDSSDGGEPMSFIEGDGSMIVGLERALHGRSPGDQFSVTIAPEDAYGHHQRVLVRSVSTDMFDTEIDQLVAGMIFQMGSGEDRQVVKIISVDEDSITIDGNHPLAGITFNFDIEVIESRPAHIDELGA